MAGKRDNVMLELSERARHFIDVMIQRRRMSKKDLTEAIIENLASMPESVQDVFLGSVPDDLRPAYLERTIAYFKDTLGKAGPPDEVADTSASGVTTIRRVPNSAQPHPNTGRGRR
jgi:hypothetical protein